MKHFKPKYRKAVFIVTYKKEKSKILYLLLKRKLYWIDWFNKKRKNLRIKAYPADLYVKY